MKPPLDYKVISYSKLVWSKGFDIGKKKAGITQDDCNGKCQWRSMGAIKGWHQCINCRTEELIKE